MATSLAQKLQIKPGMSVLLLNAPASVYSELHAELGDAVEQGDTLPAAMGRFDAVFLFAHNSDEVNTYYNTAERALQSDESLLWVAYPKKRSGVESDLSRDAGWERLTSDGWESMHVVKVDDIWSALRFKRTPPKTHGERLDEQYSGAKAALRPIYNRLVAILTDFGPDVRFEPRQSYIAVRRDKHFAAIAPTTAERVDVALKLKDAPFSDWVKPNKGVGGGSLTHMVSLASVDDISDELVLLLRAAYEINA